MCHTEADFLYIYIILLGQSCKWVDDTKIIGSLISTSRYSDDLFDIDNTYINDMSDHFFQYLC